MKFFFTSILFFFSLTINAQIKWIKHTHKKGYYSIQLPSFFTDGGYTASGIHYYFTDVEGVDMYVESMGDGTSTSLNAAYNDEIKSNTGISYTVYKPTWYVVSGFDEGLYYYHKTIIKAGNIHYLFLSYPKSQKVMFNAILPTIVKSFR